MNMMIAKETAIGAEKTFPMSCVCTLDCGYRNRKNIIQNISETFAHFFFQSTLFLS